MYSAKTFSDDEDILSDDQECDDQIPPQDMPDDNVISSDKEEDDDQVSPQFSSHDDEILSEDKEVVERIPPNCRLLYSETCLLEEAGDIVPFNKKNCNVSVSVGFMAKKMQPVNSVFNTGAVSNVIQEVFLKAEWLRAT